MDWKAKARKHKNWVEAGKDNCGNLEDKYPGVGHWSPCIFVIRGNDS